MKLPTFSGGSDKDDLPPRDFLERIEAYCKALKKDTNDEFTEMQLALRGMPQSDGDLWPDEE